MELTKRDTNDGLEQKEKDDETNRELAIRLVDLQTKWLKKCKSMEEVKEQIAL